MIERPIHPELTYDVYFEIFTSFMYNGYPEGEYGINGDIQIPVMDDFIDSRSLNDDVKVHKKYINHFFRIDPNGAQRALKQYIQWLSSEDMLCRRGIGELWRMYFTGSVSPFIQAYLDVGAKLEPLREIIQSINEEEDENDECEDGAKRRSDLKKFLLAKLESEVAALPPLPPSPPNSNNNNQGGGGKRRRRITRRRITRRHITRRCK
jgi:hypothetical protein